MSATDFSYSFIRFSVRSITKKDEDVAPREGEEREHNIICNLGVGSSLQPEFGIAIY